MYSQCGIFEVVCLRCRELLTLHLESILLHQWHSEGGSYHSLSSYNKVRTCKRFGCVHHWPLMLSLVKTESIVNINLSIHLETTFEHRTPSNPDYW